LRLRRGNEEQVRARTKLSGDGEATILATAAG
jgi:hypothetical protein